MLLYLYYNIYKEARTELYYMNFFRGKKGLVGVAKTGIALLSIIVLLTLFAQFIFPGYAVTTESTPSSISISANTTSPGGTRLNFSINNSDIGDNNIITLVNISFDTSVFAYMLGSNITTNDTHKFINQSPGVGDTIWNLSWENVTVGGFFLTEDRNGTISFNVSILNKTHMDREFTFTLKFDNDTMTSYTTTVSVNDDVDPVINASVGTDIISIPTGMAYTNNPATAKFQVNLTEDNPSTKADILGTENVTLSVRRFGVGGGLPINQTAMFCFFGSSAQTVWQCNTTIDLTGPTLAASDGDTLGFWYNMTDLAGNVGVNGTQVANLTLTVDTTLPIVKDPAKNNTDGYKINCHNYNQCNSDRYKQEQL